MSLDESLTAFTLRTPKSEILSRQDTAKGSTSEMIGIRFQFVFLVLNSGVITYVRTILTYEKIRQR